MIAQDFNIGDLFGWSVDLGGDLSIILKGIDEINKK
ncbi:hypothetical protein [Neotamlana sedimentorum]